MLEEGVQNAQNPPVQGQKPSTLSSLLRVCRGVAGWGLPQSNAPGVSSRAGAGQGIAYPKKNPSLWVNKAEILLLKGAAAGSLVTLVLSAYTVVQSDLRALKSHLKYI